MLAMQSFPYPLVWWWQLTNQWSQANEIWKRKRDQKYIYTCMLHTVCKSAITNVAIKWKFEVISDNFNLHLNLSQKLINKE